ncbi:hypothetical protein [Streptomyces sp. NPDC060322]|uniref:hypothetical protein n=1 Tax=Streptomyces sp. NPDC060322 TaxID=3347097 RepID=UPI003664AB3C
MFHTRDDYRRACWIQGRILEQSSLAKGRVRVDPRPYFSQIPRTGYQLEVGGLKRTTQLQNPRWRFRERNSEPQVARSRRSAGWEQLRLFDGERDFRRFRKADHAHFTNPRLLLALRFAERRSELYGWSEETLRLTRRGLITCLSGHEEGEKVRYTEPAPL